ncbi:DUF1853 family protein [Halomonas cupida]|uniref:DUF1853 family protein n=1 Tax=Halomonas TaxID=2745 RepID=UPI001A8FD401|nr:DUF1853 family protein [Halomonas litopenaei]MBN8411347.1 DUF1853 family protein [Halomonas litopenaei]
MPPRQTASANRPGHTPRQSSTPHSPQSGAVSSLTPTGRDLAWLLEAPDLVRSRWGGRPTLDELGLHTRKARHQLLLQALDPLPIATTDTHLGSLPRLGQYHEALWQFLLATAPGTELVAHNVPIREDRRTLGELDLLYRDTAGGLIHLEVAIKYFLGLPEGPGRQDDTSRWIGPGGLDSLALKLTHLERHQLALLSTPHRRQLLNEALASSKGRSGGATNPTPVEDTIKARLAMPGVLFYPWQHHMPPPRQANDHVLEGIWCHWRHWGELCRQHDTLRFGACLTKPHWLAPPPPTQWMPRSTLSRSLAAHFATYAFPVQVMLCDDPARVEQDILAIDGGGQAAYKNAPSALSGRRIFVVDDSWPHQVPLPPRSPV